MEPGLDLNLGSSGLFSKFRDSRCVPPMLDYQGIVLV